MCQAIRDGGRRCSIHRHTSIGVIRAAAHNSGLTRYQVERLVAELRREGSQSRRLSERQLERLVTNARASVEGNETLAAQVDRDLNLGAEHDTDIDGATGYALRLVQARAVERAQNLSNVFESVANRTGLLKSEVAEKYSQYMNEVVRVRGGEDPEEYNQNTRRRAALANLPYDVASVVALEKIKQLGTNELRRRVQRVQAGETSQLESFGYDNGRLEVTLRTDPEQVYAYRDVPEEVWERLSTSSRPGSVFSRSVRANYEYLYSTAEEADADAYVMRCVSCGQFASLSGHMCPERAAREEMLNLGLTVEEVRVALEARFGEGVLPVEDNTAIVMESSSVLEAPPETLEEANSEPALPIGEARSRSYVLPAADLTPYDPLSTATPSELLEDSLPEHIDSSTHFGAARAAELPNIFGNGVITVEEQVNTQRESSVDRMEVLSFNNVAQAQIVNASTLYRLRYGGFTALENDQTFRANVESTPSHIHYIIVQERGQEPRIVATYDERLYSGRTMQERDSGLVAKSVVLRALGTQEVRESFSASEAAQHSEEADAFLSSLKERSDVVEVEVNTLASRAYIFNRFANLASQPRVQSAKTADLRRAIESGKVATFPIKVEHAGSEDDTCLDASGITSVDQGRPYEVTGQIAVRRREDGAIENLNSVRTLKCSCGTYAQNYSCPHISYVNRNISNVVAKQVYDVPLSLSRSILTRTLSARQDVTVIEPARNEDNIVTGEPVISFGNELRIGIGNNTENSNGNLRSRFTLPESLSHINSTNSDNVSFEDLRALNKNRELMLSVSTINVPVRPSQLRQALKISDTEIPVIIRYNSYGTVQPGVVTGSITYSKADSVDESSVKSNTLKCSCSDYQERYDCEHVRFSLDQRGAILNAGSRDYPSIHVGLNDNVSRFSSLLDRNRRVMEIMDQDPQITTIEQAEERIQEILAEEERARLQAEEERRERQRIANERRIEEQRARVRRIENDNRTTITESDSYRENMMSRWQEIEGTPYSSDISVFYNDVREAERRKAAREDAIIYRTENVTDGICAPGEGTRSFGIEIEFDIKGGVDHSEAIRNIGRELQEAGLTDYSHQQGYHSGAYSGWERWSFESDSTVAGEIVSPLMKDTPEDWEQLRKVCEIVKRNGGTYSTRTGSHVHISTSSYGISTAKHAELMRQTNQNEDILYRLAANPRRGRHRGRQWCAPNSEDATGDISPELNDGYASLRGLAGRGVVNFSDSASTSYEESHVEFRLWDGSIDAAVIQQQVVVSAALTDLAERKVIENSGSFTRENPHVRIGNYRQKEVELIGERGTHTEETFSEINSEVATFIDSLVRTPEQRAGLASLFAITKWQRS